MDIKEIITKKKDLEDIILKMLVNFEDETNTVVDGFSINKSQGINQQYPLIVEFHIDVKI